MRLALLQTAIVATLASGGVVLAAAAPRPTTAATATRGATAVLATAPAASSARPQSLTVAARRPRA